MADRRRLSNAELINRPQLFQLFMAQQQPITALEGELGIFANPDGSFSTERSSTAEIDGRFVNFPLLVQGQNGAAVQRILSGNPTEADINTALNRALERERAGLLLPRFETEKAAIEAAKIRSRQK